MNILVYGAGVCGSYIASELFWAKQDVVILARGERLSYLRENGVIIKHHLQKNWATAKIPLIKELKPDAYYDVVFVVMKATQLGEALPVLEANKHCPLYIFVGSNGDIRRVCKSFSDSSRLAFGYPCSGGRIDKGIVYSYHRERPVLTLGETLGSESERLNKVAALFKKSPVRVDISPNIDAFLKYRLALSSPLSNAIQWAQGDIKKLAASDETIRLLVDAVKEGIGVLEALGYPNEPKPAVRHLKRPGALLAFEFKHKLAGSWGEELAFANYAMTAPEEIAELAAQFNAVSARANIPTPAIDRLQSYMLRP